jgi:hypothetical protein
MATERDNCIATPSEPPQQLAEHAIMEAVSVPIGANEIQVSRAIQLAVIARRSRLFD